MPAKKTNISKKPTKRAAKRAPLKTEEQKKQAIAEIYKKIELKENEKKDINKQKKWLNGREKRVNQIETQRQHLLDQQRPDQMYHEDILIKYRTKAKTEETQALRGKNSEGTIVGKKKYNELLKRNKITLDSNRLKLERGKLSFDIYKQNKALLRTDMSALRETHLKVTDYLIKRYSKGKISFEDAKKIMDNIGFCVSSAIEQHGLLKRMNLLEHSNLHSKVISQILVDYIKTGDYNGMQRIINGITLDIKQKRSVFKELQELDNYFTKKRKKLF